MLSLVFTLNIKKRITTEISRKQGKLNEPYKNTAVLTQSLPLISSVMGLKLHPLHFQKFGCHHCLKSKCHSPASQHSRKLPVPT